MLSLKKLWRKWGPNPFDALLKRAAFCNHRRFLICWNRGLGDIPLGLYALVYRILIDIPEAQITFITRNDLLEGFQLLSGVKALAAPEWKRGLAFDLDQTLSDLSLGKEDFDLILEAPNPTHWVQWQLGKLTPKLAWKNEWDDFSSPFLLDREKKYVGVHVQTQTQYGYEKNWPIQKWKEFFQRSYERGLHSIVFGFSSDLALEGEGIIDLRGKTTLFEMLSIIKNRCRYLVVPDSGVLSLIYYLDVAFPLHVVSLWADSKQGVLKQNVPSPNPLLRHVPLIGRNKNLSEVSVSAVLERLC